MSKKQRPSIETERLILRPFTLDDAPEMQRLARDREVASTMGVSFPHPFKDGMAEEWIKKYQERFEIGEGIHFAIIHQEQQYLIGAIWLEMITKHDRGGLAFWIGKPYWNTGYCTEAVQGVIRFGFEVMGLNKISASHFARNPASGRVMQKAGMKYEGYFRQEYNKWGKYEDMVWYGILKSEFEKSK